MKTGNDATHLMVLIDEKIIMFHRSCYQPKTGDVIWYPLQGYKLTCQECNQTCKDVKQQSLWEFPVTY